MTKHRLPARHRRPLGAGLAAAVLLTACDSIEPMAGDVPEPAFAVASAVAPAPLVAVAAGGAERQIWPFTGTNLGTDAHASDPINVIFTGHADPRSIRAALLALDGNRTAFPPLPFFQCTWDDAMGGNQTAWAANDGWSGSAIQLECGSYGGLRFHLRLFRLGDWTVANAHFETIIPGTHDHQVLNWELAQDFIIADFLRAQLLAAAPVFTQQINPAPYFRDIHPAIYHNPAMAPLHPVINAVIDGSTIGIRSRGRAVILNLARTVEAEPGLRRQELVIEFNQVIPKPFCAGPMDFVRVTGPLRMRQDVTVAASGVLNRQFHVEADLSVTPINPLNGTPLGPTAQGLINGLYGGSVNATVHSTSSLLQQRLLTPDQPTQASRMQLQVGPHGAARYSNDERCSE
jgi:hypothetical protein